jgi:hypothetical protein
MNKDTHIGNYLMNSVSKDLQFKYGYYAIKNRSSIECEQYNTIEGSQLEHTYFKEHQVYSQTNYNDNIGIDRLGKMLTTILVDSMKQYLPSILLSIDTQLQIVNKDIHQLGISTLPTTLEGKNSLIYSLLSDYVQTIIGSIDEKNNSLRLGKKLKDHFIGFRKQCSQIDPFSEDYLQLSEINAVVNNCEGNHMSLFCPPIEVLEYFLKDKKKHPIMKLYDPSIECFNKIYAEILHLIQNTLEDLPFCRFPKLVTKMKSEITKQVMDKLADTTREKIKGMIQIQESYIWTDEPEFYDILHRDEFQTLWNKKDYTLFRICLQKYYLIVSRIIQDSVPKCIMFYFIEMFKQLLYTDLYDKILSDNIHELLEEDTGIHNTRTDYLSKQKQLIVAKQLIETIL